MSKQSTQSRTLIHIALYKAVSRWARMPGLWEPRDILSSRDPVIDRFEWGVVIFEGAEVDEEDEVVDGSGHEDIFWEFISEDPGDI